MRAIAVDEMRHFRWTNEALVLLDSQICLDRATEFEPRANQIRGKFELRALTPERLDFFIQVEAPSQSSGDPHSLDGLYTQLLNSLDNEIEGIDAATWRRLSEIVKMIIDEGNEHWIRLENVKILLTRYSPEAYLRVPGGPVGPPADGNPDNDHVRDLQTVADWNYRIILDGIRQAFEDKPLVDRAEHITEARLTMYNLDSVGQELAERHYGMFFRMPKKDSKDQPVLQVLQDRDATKCAHDNATNALQRLKTSQTASVRRLALRHLSRLTKTGPGRRD